MHAGNANIQDKRKACALIYYKKHKFRKIITIGVHTCSDTVMSPPTRRDSITQFSVLSGKGRMWEKD